MIYPYTDSYVHGILKSRSNSKFVDKSIDQTRSYASENPRKVMENEISGFFLPVITRTSPFSRKSMVKEISGLFLPVTGARLRDLNSGSSSGGDHGGEIQKTRSPMYIGDEHDYNLNRSSMRIHDPPC